MTPKVCADHPDQPRKATREAMTDVEIIAQILQAMGEGPDDIEGAVVYWLGKRLYAAAEVLEAEA